MVFSCQGCCCGLMVCLYQFVKAAKEAEDKKPKVRTGRMIGRRGPEGKQRKKQGMHQHVPGAIMYTSASERGVALQRSTVTFHQSRGHGNYARLEPARAVSCALLLVAVPSPAGHGPRRRRKCPFAKRLPACCSAAARSQPSYGSAR